MPGLFSFTHLPFSCPTTVIKSKYNLPYAAEPMYILERRKGLSRTLNGKKFQLYHFLSGAISAICSFTVNYLSFCHVRLVLCLHSLLYSRPGFMPSNLSCPILAWKASISFVNPASCLQSSIYFVMSICWSPAAFSRTDTVSCSSSQQKASSQNSFNNNYINVFPVKSFTCHKAAAHIFPTNPE